MSIKKSEWIIGIGAVALIGYAYLKGMAGKTTSAASPSINSSPALQVQLTNTLAANSTVGAVYASGALTTSPSGNTNVPVASSNGNVQSLNNWISNLAANTSEAEFYSAYVQSAITAATAAVNSNPTTATLTASENNITAAAVGYSNAQNNISTSSPISFLASYGVTVPSGATNVSVNTSNMTYSWNNQGYTQIGVY